MSGVREAGSIAEKYTLRLWSAKQVRTKAAFRLWYLKHVLRGEPELRLVAALCDPERLTLDVGANRGMYSVAALRFSRGVIAFEPQPHFADLMRRLLPKGVRIVECAVSHRGGVSTLLVPKDPRYHAEARLAPEEELVESGAARSTPVRTVSLDEVVDDPVGLVKIDVEGHELAVLSGARKLIDASRPNIIIELEDRHQSGTLARAWDWFEERNYEGFCLKNGQLIQIRPPIGGNASGRNGYIYNFVFLPSERKQTPRPSLWPALSSVLAV